MVTNLRQVIPTVNLSQSVDGVESAEHFPFAVVSVVFLCIKENKINFSNPTFHVCPPTYAIEEAESAVRWNLNIDNPAGCGQESFDHGDLVAAEQQFVCRPGHEQLLIERADVIVESRLESVDENGVSLTFQGCGDR